MTGTRTRGVQYCPGARQQWCLAPLHTAAAAALLLLAAEG
jgi:hypothetical protein